MTDYGIHWTAYVSAIGPTMIACLVAFIAFQQWRINRATLREKLFEKRWQVFKESQSFLSEILREAKFEQESYWQFTDTCQRARFLFDTKTHQHLLEIRTRAVKLRLYQKQYETLPVGPERSALVEKEHDELVWLTDQLDPLFDMFLPFISFQEAG